MQPCCRTETSSSSNAASTSPAARPCGSRRIAGETIRPGAVLDGEVLIEVGLPHQIDNMEGIAVSPHPRGHRITLVSDDNRSLLQRTLLLEFLLEGVVGALASHSVVIPGLTRDPERRVLY